MSHEHWFLLVFLHLSIDILHTRALPPECYLYLTCLVRVIHPLDYLFFRIEYIQTTQKKYITEEY